MRANKAKHEFEQYLRHRGIDPAELSPRAGGNRDSCSSEGYFEAEQADTSSVAAAQADVTSGLCFSLCLQLSHKWSN
jgi:hypothetical protein